MALAEGLLDRRDRYRSLATDWNCGYLDITTEPIDTDLQAGYDPAALARDAWLPLHHDDEGYVLVAVAAEPTPELVAMIEEAVGAPVCVAVTSDWDLREAIRRAYPRRPSSRFRLLGVAAAAVLVTGAALFFAAGPTLVAVAMLVSAGYLTGIGAVVVARLRGGGLDLGPLALLTTPPLYLLFAAALVLPAERVVPDWALGVPMAGLLAGNAALVYVDLLDAFRQGGAVGPALLSPVRWLLYSAAAYRDLGRPLSRPRDRGKASHGNRTVHSGDPALAAVEPG